MESTRLCSSSFLPSLPTLPKPKSLNKYKARDYTSSTRTRTNKVSYGSAISATRRDNTDHQHDFDHPAGGAGHLVDECMIILRKRIHEMKVMERNYEPPSDWMDWEKRLYVSYDSLVCDLVGRLQSQLMNTRPSLALAFLALISLSIPTSAGFLLFHLLVLSKDLAVGLDTISMLN